MSRNQDKTAVHGCHSTGNLAERMRKVLVKPWSCSQSPQSVWSAEATRLDFYDNPKPEAEFRLLVRGVHVRACSKVHKLSMREGSIPGRNGGKVTSLPHASTRPWAQMTNAKHPSAEDLSGACFKSLSTMSNLFQILGTKESNNVNSWFNFCFWLKAAFLGRFAFQNFKLKQLR